MTRPANATNLFIPQPSVRQEMSVALLPEAVALGLEANRTVSQETAGVRSHNLQGPRASRALGAVPCSGLSGGTGWNRSPEQLEVAPTADHHQRVAKFRPTLRSLAKRLHDRPTNLPKVVYY